MKIPWKRLSVELLVIAFTVAALSPYWRTVLLSAVHLNGRIAHNDPVRAYAEVYNPSYESEYSEGWECADLGSCFLYVHVLYFHFTAIRKEPFPPFTSAGGRKELIKEEDNHKCANGRSAEDRDAIFDLSHDCDGNYPPSWWNPRKLYDTGEVWCNNSAERLIRDPKTLETFAIQPIGSWGGHCYD